MVPDLAQLVPGYNQTTNLWIAFAFPDGFFINTYLYPRSNNQKQVTLTDQATLLLGQHTLKFGVDYRRISTRETIPQLSESAEFMAPDDVISGVPGYGSITTSPYPAFHPVYMTFATFLQDNWKATNRLNVSLGLRWELAPAPTDTDGRPPYTVDQISNLATTMLAPGNTPLWKTTYRNFAPRVGLAYQLRQTPGWETILRAGFGIYYDTARANGSIGYAGIGYTANSYVGGTPFPFSTDQIAATGLPSTAAPYNSMVVGFDPHLRLPYTLQWSAAVEQRLGSHQSFTVSYLGNGGRQSIASTYHDPSLVGNPAFSLQNDLAVVANAATSSYNALQLKFQRQFAHGFQVLASYVWSHAIDDASTNFYVLDVMRASSDFDVRHNFQYAITYSVPGTYRKALASALLGGWSLASRLNARSALPVDIIGAQVFDPVGAGQWHRYHPDLVPGQPIYLYGPQYPGGRALNYNAFTVAEDSSGNPIEGDVARNSARGFPLVQLDLSLAKDFRVTERLGLEFRAEAFNLLNRANFGDIDNFLSDGNVLFGKAYDTANTQLGILNSLYQAGGPRSVQLTLRLHF